MSDILIRDFEAKDESFILELNEVNVEVLSPMDEAKLRYFEEKAEMLRVVEVDGRQAAFLIALREGLKEYGSENYIWFSKEYESFLYIDRIVIGEDFRRFGIGRMLYDDVCAHAVKTGVKTVTCEVDTVPYNEASLNFHEAMGFKEVGEQIIRGGSVKVSLKAKEVL